MYISGVTMISSKTLDPDSPDYKWEDGGSIAGYESPDDFINPIDPGAFLDPNDGRLSTRVKNPRTSASTWKPPT